MVPVRVDEQELAAVTVSLIAQLHPRRDARERGVPPLAPRHIGRGTQPQVALAQLLEAVALEEDRRVLALRLPIRPADADELVRSQLRADFFRLGVDDLLEADEVGI